MHRDVSRTFKFMIKEFQASEDAGERVWIIGPVLSRWDGSYSLMNPTVSFLQNDQPILSRRNCQQSLGLQPRGPDYDSLSQQWRGPELQHCSDIRTDWPSGTPLTNLNFGIKLYEVDTENFDIYEAQTLYSNVNSFSALNSTGQTYGHIYSPVKPTEPRLYGQKIRR